MRNHLLRYPAWADVSLIGTVIPAWLTLRLPLIEAGVDLYTVSRRLGHATTAVTELHYVDPSEKADEAAADALGDLPLLAPGAER